MSLLDIAYTQTQNPLVPTNCRGANAFSACTLVDFADLVNGIVSFIIMLAGVGFVFLLLWAGIYLVLYGDNEGKRSEAKRMIWRGVLGLSVAVLSYTIVSVLFSLLGYTHNEGKPFEGFDTPSPPEPTIPTLPTHEPISSSPESDDDETAEESVPPVDTMPPGENLIV